MDPDEAKIVTQLEQIQTAIGKGQFDEVKSIIDYFHQNLNTQILSDFYSSGSANATQTNLILTAVLNKQADILKYLINDYLPAASFHDGQVIKQETKAFDIVEMIYDYWCGDLHWMGHNINRFKTIGNLLSKLSPNRQDQQHLVNYHCLIRFNAFQQKLYTSLPNLDPESVTASDTANMLITALRIYNEYSDLDKVRIPHSLPDKEREIIDDLQDESSVHRKSLVYICYELYFRKLNFNISLLILENWYVLRRHFQKRFNKKEIYFQTNPGLENRYTDAVTLFKQIECTLYHFIYRTREDWRLYLPSKRQLTVENYHTGIHEGRLIKDLILTYDSKKLFNGPVLFFEWRNFKKILNDLITISNEHVISNDPVHNQIIPKNDKTEVKTLLDDNYLHLALYMNDYYSLQKIVFYIESIEKTKNVSILMIERVLQVVGEMLKSTDQSNHLSKSTKAKLQVAISVETMKRLHNIRDFLSHANKGQLSTRINLTNKHKTNFEDIKSDLTKIKERIRSVLDIHETILDKSLLEKGISLLEERINEIVLPNSSILTNDLHPDKIYARYNALGNALVDESGEFVQLIWNKTGLTIELLREIPYVLQNKHYIASETVSATKRFNDRIVHILLKYIQSMKDTLTLIKKNNNDVAHLNKELAKNNLKVLPEYPDNISIINMKKYVRKRVPKIKNIAINVGLLDKIQDFSDHWSSIKEILTFCFNCELFHSITKLGLNLNDSPDDKTLTDANIILRELEAVCAKHQSASTPGIPVVCKNIESLWENDYSNQIATTDPPRTAREKLILCLLDRVRQIQYMLGYPQPMPLRQQLLKYQRDLEFRTELEMLLADTANVLIQCKIQLMNKSDMLLREIDLRNVLHHGNPFLEVIGHCNDLSRAFLLKAIMYAEDGESINALYELFKGNVKYETIKNGDMSKMDNQQQIWYQQLLKSKNWELYAKLTRVK